MLQDGGFVQENDSTKMGCHDSRCLLPDSVCCEETSAWIKCCPSYMPKCIERSGEWYCKAGAANFSINVGVLAAIAILTSARANFF